MTKLSDTQRMILSAATQRMILNAASQHALGYGCVPKTLHAAARNAVFRSLIKNNLLTEINAPREHVGLGWRQDEDDTWIVARITDEGLRAIGIDPNEGDAGAGEPDCSGIEGNVPDTADTGADDAAVGNAPAEAAEPAQGAPTPAPRASLRDAAAAVLAAWDASPAQDAIDNPISRAIEALRVALASKRARTPRDANAPRKPREGTKQEAMLAMLRRPEGATVAQIDEATGWAPHTVRGFFAGLKNKGRAVEVRERIRQVGPNGQGARGSHSIYKLAPHAG